MTSYHITNLSLDQDTGVLTVRFGDGAEFLITNPGHARTLRDKIKPGDVVTDEQMRWLEKYRIDLRNANREMLRDKLKKLRRELWQP